MSALLRRIWWATLPYDHWRAEWRGGHVPGKPPWWALAPDMLHRVVNLALWRRDVFGPQANAWFARPLVGSKKPEVWQ